MTQVVSTVEEVEALVVPDPDKVAYLTQTTLSLDEAGIMINALKKKFPNIVGPHAEDICYATENRQTAVKNVAHGADLVLGGWIEEQLELEPAGRGFEEPRYELLPDRYRGRDSAGVAGRR